jgi:hypothetical protein
MRCGAVKSGGREVTVGEVSVKCAGNTGFPGFEFFRQGDNCALRGRRWLPKEKLQLGGSKEGGWMYTNWQPGVQNGNPGLDVMPEMAQEDEHQIWSRAYRYGFEVRRLGEDELRNPPCAQKGYNEHPKVFTNWKSDGEGGTIDHPSQLCDMRAREFARDHRLTVPDSSQLANSRPGRVALAVGPTPHRRPPYLRTGGRATISC